MLACFAPVCAKTADNEIRDAEGGEPKPVTSKHGIKLFTFQLKQMATRFTAGALQKRCRSACVTAAVQQEVRNEHPTFGVPSDGVNSPQFSLKSYQIGCRTPDQDSVVATQNRYDSVRERTGRAVRSLQRNFAGSIVGDEGTRDVQVDSKLKVPENEWVAQVEPGVYITFCMALDGYNDLKRIKFSRAMFSKERAESWWAVNCPMVRELYNVRPPSLACTDDERLSSGYATPDTYNKSPFSAYSGGDYQLTRRKSAADSRLKDDYLKGDESGNHSWVEQDEPGVYLTIITVPGVGKQLKRVRFSRDKYSEREASVWWESNRQRVYAQYIFTNTRLQCK